MDDGPVRYFIAILFLFFLSAYFAAAETAFSAVNRIRVSVRAENADRSAKRVLYVLDHFDKALTTMLIGINISHMGIATLSTLITYELFGDAKTLPEYALALCTLITTIIVFFVSELIPKSFAKACCDKLSQFLAPSLILSMHILTPFSFIFSAISKLASRPFKKKAEAEPTVTEDELYDIIETYVEENDIDEDTEELVQNAIEFSESTVRDVMTPWHKVTAISVDESADGVKDIIKNEEYSRYPVVDNDGKVIGTLRTRSFLKEYIKNHSVKVRNVMNPPEFISQNTPVDELLDRLSNKRTHIAYVGNTDNVLGIITIEDILEELVGEIYDEADALGGDIND